jgi:ABC-type Fe3+-hydroxamate transport system substrate-binding protein
MRDDQGNEIVFDTGPSRVVSIVPSLTESVAITAPGLLVGATDWCTHPRDLDVVRVRGTKNPDVPAIVDLRPDVVLANAEENRQVDLDAMRARGLRVWVTAPETVPQAVDSLTRMLQLLELDMPRWLDDAATVWSHDVPVPTRSALIPIWRRPWMALGRDTFAGDVLARLGVRNVLADHQERYPRVDLAALPAHDLVVLPDEPYAFSRTDGPESFPGIAVACVSGRHLTWYGPSLAEAHRVLSDQIAAATMT